MKFYPIVYTRTALRNLAKGRDGVDFIYRALAPSFAGSPLERLMRQTINEDRFKEITTPRRVFCRTENYLFWGLGLHNEFFLPSEVCDALELTEGERKLRGFWGGLIELSDGDVLSNETLNLIASTLESREADSALPNDAASLDETQPLEGQAFVGRSSFVFASRLFQRFVQKDWTNVKVPKRVGEKNLNNAPLISETPFDLRFFAPGSSETTEVAPLPVDASQLFASANFNDVDETNALWRRVVFAPNERLRVVAPLTCENQADRCVSSDFELDATALLDASGVRVYCPKAPPEPETPPRSETPDAEADDARSRDFETTREKKKTSRSDKWDGLNVLTDIRKWLSLGSRVFWAGRPPQKAPRRSERPETGNGDAASFEERAKRPGEPNDADSRDKTPQTSRHPDEKSGDEERRPVEPEEIDFYAGRGQDASRSDANDGGGMF